MKLKYLVIVIFLISADSAALACLAHKQYDSWP